MGIPRISMMILFAVLMSAGCSNDNGISNGSRGMFGDIFGSKTSAELSPEQQETVEALGDELMLSGKLMYDKVIPLFCAKQGFDYGKLSPELIQQLNQDFLSYLQGGPKSTLRTIAQEVLLSTFAGNKNLEILRQVRERLGLRIVDDLLLNLDVISHLIMSRSGSEIEAYVKRARGPTADIANLQEVFMEVIGEAVEVNNVELARQGCVLILEDMRPFEKIEFMNTLFAKLAVRQRNKASTLESASVYYQALVDRLDFTNDQRLTLGTFVVDAQTITYDQLFSRALRVSGVGEHLKILALRKAVDLMTQHFQADADAESSQATTPRRPNSGVP